MTKRLATIAELEAAPVLAIRLPPSAHASDPISHGARPDLYLESDLKKVATMAHARTVEFEQRLVAIWWKTGRPVPFIFKTADGAVRSLDAGCVGFLLNRFPPSADPITDAVGYVIAVIPRQARSDLYEPLKSRLVAELEPL